MSRNKGVKQAEDLVMVCGVFIHWQAADDKNIYEYIRQSNKLRAGTSSEMRRPAPSPVASSATVRTYVVGGTQKCSAKRIIMIWLAGGPAHIDIFDPKPDDFFR